MILGITFIYASIHKIMDPAGFAEIIFGYGLFPAFSINLIAILIPWFELFCGASLVFGIAPKAGALWLALMLLGFIIAISINLVRGYTFDCGCFTVGAQDHQSSALQLLIRDIGLLITAAYIMVFPKKMK